MTGYFRDKAVSQIDAILVDGQKYGEKQLKALLKDVVAEPLSKSKKGKK